MTNPTTEASSIRHLRAKFAGTCKGCGRRFQVGAEIVWVSRDKTTYHEACWATPDAECDGVTNLCETCREYGPYHLTRTFTGYKAEQFGILSALNESWDGEPHIIAAEAKNLSDRVDAGTWTHLERPSWL